MRIMFQGEKIVKSRIVNLSLVLFLLILSLISISSAASWKKVESFAFDWNNNGKPDTFSLEVPDNRQGEPGDFTRLVINIPGKKEFVLEDKYGLTDYANYSHSKTVPIDKNLFANKSKYLVLSPMENNKSESSLLFVFGWEYSSRPGILYIISLNKDGYPEIIFKNELEVLKLEGINKDGYAELIGYHSYSEFFGPKGMFSSYCPRYAYAIRKAKTGLAITFDEKLSEAYNKKNYYWAGLKPSEEMVIVNPRDKSGKAEFMSLKDAKAKYIK